MSTSAPAENPLPETSVVVLGGLLAGDTVMDWLKLEAASHRMAAEQAGTYFARERILARDIQTLLRGLAPQDAPTRARLPRAHRGHILCPRHPAVHYPLHERRATRV